MKMLQEKLRLTILFRSEPCDSNLLFFQLGLVGGWMGLAIGAYIISFLEILGFLLSLLRLIIKIQINVSS